MANHKRWNNIVNRLFICMLVFTFFLPRNNVIAQGANSATLSIVVPPGPYSINQEITIAVAVDTPFNTLGAQFGLTFNPAVLQCLHGDEGTFYSDWAAIHGVSTSVYPTPKCNNTGVKAGTISDIAVFIQGTTTGGATGQGVIATYTFKIIAEGYSTLDFLNIPGGTKPDVPLLFDDGPGTSQKPLPLTLVPSGIQVGAVQSPSETPTMTATETQTPTFTFTPTITNTSPAITELCLSTDVNNDGVVNVGDLAAIGTHWNENGSPGWIASDVNHDGVISVGDLITVGACWEGVIPPATTNTHTFTPTISPTASNNPTVTLTPTPGSSSTATITPTRSVTSTVTMSPSASTTLTLTKTPALTSTLKSTPTYTTGAQLRIEPDIQVVGILQDFVVDVLLNTTETTRGAATNLSWDPAVLQLTSYEEGNYFSSWVDQWNITHPDDLAEVNFFPKPAIDNVNGRLKDNSPASIFLTGANSNGGNGPGASGVFLRLHFKSLKQGTSQIHLSTASVYSFTMQTPTAAPSDPDGKIREPVQKPLTVTIVDGEVNVSNEVASLTPTNTLSPTITNTATITPTKTLTRTVASTSYLSNTGTPVAVPTVASAARIGFDPSQSLIPSVDSTFTVKVAVNADKPVRGVSVDVKFDPSIIQCQSVDEGDFLSTWASSHSSSSMVFPSFKIDNTAGTIKDGAIILIGTTTGGATGIGSIIKINCKAKAVGVSQLTITSGILFDDGPGTANHKYAVALDSGQVFVGVTPTPTPFGAATATGGSGVYSTTSTPVVSGAIGTTTLNPSASMVSTGNAPGITAPSNMKSIPVTGGENLCDLIGSLDGLIDANGIVLEDIILQSSDKLFAVVLSKGVQAVTADNYPLTQIVISCSDKPIAEKSPFTLLNSAFELGPTGSVFSPPITIMFAYDPNNLPKGVLPQDLSIGYFDTDSNQWESLHSKLNKKDGTVSASIEHFSTYGLLGNPPAIRWSLVAGGIAGFLILLGAVVFLTIWLKKRSLAIKSEEVTIKLLQNRRVELLESGLREQEEVIEATINESIEEMDLNQSELREGENGNLNDKTKRIKRKTRKQ